MGCIWSSQGDFGEQCRQCSRVASNDLIIINRVCEICIRNVTRGQKFQLTTSIRPCYGEYRCPCGRAWNSRLSWPHGYQKCKYCNRSVYSHTQRELRKSDMTHKDQKVQEHPQDLCQMCKQLGFYCGEKIRRKNARKNNVTRNNKMNFI